MTTAKFTKEEFEQALTDSQKDTSKQLWEYVGFEKSEHVYKIHISNGTVKRVAILIRSSVQADGFAASTGEDSIRMWLVDTKTNKPLGKKVDAYTQRIEGWNIRMASKIKELYTRGYKMHNCPKCDGIMIERKGKFGTFYGCSNYPLCKHTQNSIDTKPEAVQITLDEAAELLQETQPASVAQRVDFTPSRYQKAVFDFIQAGNGNAVVEAVAGSGKTTTILKALEFTPSSAKVAFVAFNKKIAEELKEKSPSHVEVSTLHSLGFKNIRAIFRNVKVDNKKVYWIIKDYLKLQSNPSFVNSIKENMANVIRLVSLLKATMLNPTVGNLEYLCDNYSISLNGDFSNVYQMVEVAFNKSIQETWRIDFDDMIYFCASGKAACAKFDWLFIDEAQDLNKAQIQMILNSTHENTRIIAVGDRKQSIYGFRAADTKAIENLISELDATLLPLSITYRCPKSHVALVQGLVPQIEAYESASEGTIKDVAIADLLHNAKDGDLVLCRTNAPLVSPAFALIRAGKKAVILGRDIGEGLIDLIEKIVKKHKSQDILSMLYDLQSYGNKEYANLISQDKERQAQMLDDQVQTINALSEGCQNIEELKIRISNVFSDNSQGVTFSSVHKAKGGEANTVYILHPELMPHPMALKSSNREALQQEYNIKYVALTRSKNELFFVR